MLLSYTLKFPDLESLNDFELDQHFSTNATLINSYFRFTSMGLSENSVCVTLTDNNTSFKQQVKDRFEKLVIQFGGTVLELTESDEKLDLFIAREYIDHKPGQVLVLQDVPVSNYAAAESLQSAFGPSITESGATLEIGTKADDAKVFSITYTRGNTPDEDVENGIVGLLKARAPEKGDGTRTH